MCSSTTVERNNASILKCLGSTLCKTTDASKIWLMNCSKEDVTNDKSVIK